jgi:hypothetical protein
MFSLAESSMQLSRLAPLQLLVLGWGEQDFMAQLIAALCTGEARGMSTVYTLLVLKW